MGRRARWRRKTLRSPSPMRRSRRAVSSDPLPKRLVDPPPPTVTSGLEVIDHVPRQADRYRYLRFDDRRSASPNRRPGELFRPSTFGKVRCGVPIKTSGHGAFVPVHWSSSCRRSDVRHRAMSRPEPRSPIEKSHGDEAVPAIVPPIILNGRCGTREHLSGPCPVPLPQARPQALPRQTQSARLILQRQPFFTTHHKIDLHFIGL